MQAISIHVVDVANGVVATGMRVDVVRLDALEGADAARRPPHERVRPTTLVQGKVGRNGVVDGIEGREAPFDAGVYELHLHIGDYFRARGTPLPEPAFMDVQVFRFGLADASQHYHLPIKFTPWGLSCFRGAA